MIYMVLKPKMYMVFHLEIYHKHVCDWQGIGITMDLLSVYQSSCSERKYLLWPLDPCAVIVYSTMGHVTPAVEGCRALSSSEGMMHSAL